MTLTKKEEALAAKELSDILRGLLAGLVWALILVGPMIYFGKFVSLAALYFLLVPVGGAVGMYTGRTGTLIIGLFFSCLFGAVVTLAYWPKIFG
jgi:hypothetical protein